MIVCCHQSLVLLYAYGSGILRLVAYARTVALTSLNYQVHLAMRTDALAQLRHRGRHGDPTHDRNHRSHYGDEPGDGSNNFAWTGPQISIQSLPSTVDKHHSELLPSVLP